MNRKKRVEQGLDGERRPEVSREETKETAKKKLNERERKIERRINRKNTKWGKRVAVVGMKEEHCVEAGEPRTRGQGASNRLDQFFCSNIYNF